MSLAAAVPVEACVQCTLADSTRQPSVEAEVASREIADVDDVEQRKLRSTQETQKTGDGRPAMADAMAVFAAAFLTESHA